MQVPSQEQKHRPPIEEEFRSLLLSEWTHSVACQNECDPPESCSCQRKITHVHALEKWWTEQSPDDPGQTKGHRFLDEMRLAPHRTFPPKYEKIFTGERSCCRVLSLLLQQDRPHLIDCFYDANMNDRFLGHDESDLHLRESLLGYSTQEEVDVIIKDFQRDRWAYCPMNLTLDMDVNLHGTKVILPFCSKIKLPDKGGTASIYWVAVQKDLISDTALAYALRESLYKDEEFGECYQMVLKSYCGNKKLDFELEKEAFSGLHSKKDVPILQYLGSYTHDYGEGENIGKTYNLLLEYGDHDLYQAWADETNVPPVRGQEILRTWDSLFEIAKAISHVHHLEVPRGGKSEPRRFHGWHADIKPDNILSIRKKLRLADFGFSSFAPVIEGHYYSEPTELIRGFTDTYGAPELFRMTRPDGTLSGVSRSIDIWSFGCVLSVAATWIVLGFQGIRQYEQLRQLAPANRQNGTMYDRFHNGWNVLPEVRKWHNYLRGHLRRSDTTTELVLDLIENDLLRSEPGDRPDSEKLCEKLRELKEWAESKISRLDKHSRETDAAVLTALSEIEDKARTQRVSETKTNSPLLQPPIPAGVSHINPRQWASMQLRKEEMIKSKPLGQTPYRKDILRQELGARGLGLFNDSHSVHEGHHGAITQSPDQSTYVHEPSFRRRQPKREDLPLQGIDQYNPDTQQNTTGNEFKRPVTTPTTPTPPPRRSKPQDQNAVAIEINAPKVASSGLYDDSGSRKPGGMIETTPPNASTLPRIVTHLLPLSPPSTPDSRVTGYGTRLESSPPEHIAQIPGGMQGSISRLTTSSPEGSAYIGKQVYDPGSIQLSHTNITSSFDSIKQVKPVDFFTEDEPMELHDSDGNFSREEVAKSQLPASVLDLPYSICERRKKLDKEKPKRMSKIASMLGKETRKGDSTLKDISSDRRELVFVIDNGWTMFEHWPILIFVVETLAMNAAGVDKSGIDLRFTVDGSRHNGNNIRGDSGRRSLKEKLERAWPENRPKDNATTDMVTIFENLYKEWKAHGKPATTLYVFTDGKWSKQDPAALEEVALDPESRHEIILNPPPLHKTILEFAKKDKRVSGNRHFSIQFIRFGDDETDKKQLQWLDDHLCASHKLRDIIDHCSWRATVDKIFMGSIKGFQDEKEPEELDIAYDYEKLVERFHEFNKGEKEAEERDDHTVHHSPSSMPSPLLGTPSHVLSRSSTSTLRKRESMPPSDAAKHHSKRMSFFQQ